MTDLAIDVTSAVRRGDLDAVFDLLAPLGERERGALAVTANALHRAVHSAASRLAYRSGACIAEHEAAALAVAATGTWSDQKHLRYCDSRRTVDMLRARRPSWFQQWADRAIDAPRTEYFWPTYRSLVRDGYVEATARKPYLHGLFRQNPRDVFSRDPSLLEREVWQLFEIEGAGEFSFAAVDKYRLHERTWAEVLAKLANDGRLDRPRLLDASLAALERDSNAFEASWFARFHESLDPTLAERSARLDAYRRLLGHRDSARVRFAFDALGIAIRGGATTERRIMHDVAAVVAVPQKTTALAALKLYARAAASDGATEVHLPVFVRALEHPHRDVATFALERIEALAPHGTDARSLLASARPKVAPALRSRLDAVLGERARRTPVTASPQAVVTPNASKTTYEPDPGNGADGIVPFARADELVEPLVGLIERGGTASSIERILDGISRFPAPDTVAFRRLSRPLRERITATNGSCEDFTRRAIARLAVAWLERTMTPLVRVPSGPPRFLACRLDEIAARGTAGIYGSLLAAPTAADGSIDPVVLAARLSRGVPVGRVDLIAALYRLRRNDLDAARETMAGLATPSTSILRYVLGISRQPKSSDGLLPSRASGRHCLERRRSR